MPSRTIAALLVVCACVSNHRLTASECTIQTLDENFKAEFLRLDDQGLVIKTENANKVLLLDQLLGVDFPVKHFSDTVDELGEVRTKLGSRLFVHRFEVQGDQVVISPRWNSKSKLFLPKGDLKAILLPQQANETEWQYWREACESNVSTDQLIVRGRSSGSLRAIEGFIESFNDQGINFQMEGDLISVSWNRLFGVVFYSDPETVQESIGIEIHDGSHLEAISVSAAANEAVANISSGQAFSLPLEAIKTLDFSVGKLFLLGELPRLKSAWNNRLGVPDFIDYSPRFGESFRGESLSLLQIDPRLEGVIQEVSYEDGLALRSGSIVKLRIPDSGRRLRGQVGIDPRTSRSGAVVITISLGDENIYKESIIGEEAPKQLDLLLADPGTAGRVLSIQVEAVQEEAAGGNLHFVDARITK